MNLNYLTKVEVEEITNNSKNRSKLFEIYGDSTLFNLKNDYKRVWGISKCNIVLIDGNEYTGLKHINERHSFWTTEIYIRKDDKGSVKFQNQSRFPQNIAPIDYLDIADKIFNTSGIQSKHSHRDSELFDEYQGDYYYSDLKKTIKTRLILYKNSKIIHSLFPVRDVFNPKRLKKFNFFRGKVLIRTNESIEKKHKVKETFIPYFDLNIKLKYGFSIQYDSHDKSEKLYLLLFNQNDYSFNYVLLKEGELPKFKGELYEKTTYQYNDLRNIEELIKFFDKKIDDREIELGEKFKLLN